MINQYFLNPERPGRSQSRKTSRLWLVAGISAISLMLSACGGGGGGSGLVSTPIPPPTPTPTPSSLPPPTVDLLPGKKTPIPSVMATDGGPKLNLENVTIPLITTAVTANFSGDAATINSGATMWAMDGAKFLDIRNPAFVEVSYQGGTIPSHTLSDGRKLFVYVASNPDLDYTVYGNWWVGTSTANNLTMEDNAAFVGGLETPLANIPTSGSASYSGKVVGHYSDYYLCSCASFSGVVGNVSLSANFGNRTLSGLMTQMQVIPDTALSGFMNDVSFAASFANAQNWFSGTTAVASNPNTPFALAGNASGSIVGSFFGPSAQEIGAVWTLSDGSRRVIGSFGAKAGN